MSELKTSKVSKYDEIINELNKEKGELENELKKAEKQRFEETEALKCEMKGKVADLEVKVKELENGDLNLKSLNQSLMLNLKELRSKLDEQTGVLNRDLDGKVKGLFS